MERWLVGQAVAGAICAGASAVLTPKLFATLVAAATRGAVQGLHACSSAAALADSDSLDTVEEIQQVLNVHAIGAAVAALRSCGRNDLAKRVQKLDTRMEDTMEALQVAALLPCRNFDKRSNILPGTTGMLEPELSRKSR